MNLRFVEAFHWASALKSITRAAEKLHLSQSALSDRIAALESELGVVLLDRRDKQFRLTIVGQRFQLLAQKLLELQRQVKEELGSHPGSPMVLRIGAIESVVHSWLPGWLQDMRHTHPGFELELTVETSPVLIDQIRRGVQDLVFAAIASSDTDVRTRQMTRIDMVFVGHRALHKRPRYSLADLGEHDLITFQKGSQPHQALLQMLLEAGVAPPRVHAISSISAMMQLVEGGFGVATLPRVAAQRLSNRLPLKILRTDVVPQPLPIHASYREDPGSGMVQEVLDSAVTYVAQNAVARDRGQAAPP